VPWIHARHGTAPFADFTLRHVRRLLADRGEDEGQQAIAQALDDLLTRAGTGPTPIPPTSRRITARTRAAAATTLRPVDTPPADDAPTESGSTPPAVDAATEPDDTTDRDAAEPSGRDAVVIPFGVFDADKEAERFW
jgi:putative transposase